MPECSLLIHTTHQESLVPSLGVPICQSSAPLMVVASDICASLGAPDAVSMEPRNPNAHQQSRGRASSPRGVFYSSEDARAGRGLRDARRRPWNRASERGRVQAVRAACCTYAQPGQQRRGRARRGRGAVTRRGNVALRGWRVPASPSGRPARGSAVQGG